MGGSKFFYVISYIIFKQSLLRTPMKQHKYAIEALAVIDVDPALMPFVYEQQKWLTSIDLTGQPPRDRPNLKYFAIVPGIYLLLGFCQKNKDPIFEIEFNNKPGADWSTVRISEAMHNNLGAHLCYKTEPSLASGPICDVDLLGIERKSRFGESKEIINVPHSYKLVSHQLPFGYLIFKKVKSKIEQSFRSILAEKYLTPGAERINFSQLPLFCFPDGIKIVKQIRGFMTFNFVLTLETAERIFVTCLIFKQTLSQQKRQKLQVYTNEQLFHEKALCVLSSQCYTDQFGECLQNLYRLSMSKSDTPFWRIAQTFVNQMRMPLKQQIGEVGLTYSYGGNKINFHTNSKYPHVSERALYSIFKFMTIQNIISVFESLLLERKVFFVSQSKTILGYATQAFLGLLFPFRWEQVLIPVLPSNLKEYLTAPVPLVAGISPSLVDSSIQSDSVIVYLDKNEVLNDQDNPPLPEKLLKQLQKRLEKLEIYDAAEVSEFLENPESTYLFKMQEVQDPHFHGCLVRDSFYEFILTLMKNYKKFMNLRKKSKQQQSSMMSFENSSSMSNIFKVQDFLSDLGMTKVGSFGYKFTESSIFTSFLERKFVNPSQPEALFFDDCIQRKKSKKETSFISAVVNKQYRVIKNAEPNPDEPGPFFYNQFPSLLKEPVLREQQIQVHVFDEKEQENKLIALLEQEYHLNHSFYQQVQVQQPITHKILGLLLNKNKTRFQNPGAENHSGLINWFLALYEKQNNQVESLLNEWPAAVCESQFNAIKKSEYLICNKKFRDNTITGVQDGGDYQIIIRNEVKILFVSTASETPYKGSSIVVEIASHKMKDFVNRIIPKQAGFLIDYCLKQAAKDLRASTLKKASEQSWTIETLLQFRNWLHYEKEFGTGVTND